MKKLAIIVLLYLPLVVCAQKTPSAIEKKVLVCGACHGQTGVSPKPQWPNLAGQHVRYFVKQLKDMQAGTHRNAPTMTAFIVKLNDKEIDEMAAYYANIPIAKGITPQKLVKRGEQLYRGGDFEKQITACIACHGPQGLGNDQAGFPVLAGQHSYYTVLQLQAYKKGQRTNDLSHVMQSITNRMSHDDMEAVAHYIEGLH